MNDEKKLFEVILAPSDRLEKELEDVLGGNRHNSISGDSCTNNCVVDCGENCTVYNCKPNAGNCPPGYIWDGCKCVPIIDE